MFPFFNRRSWNDESKSLYTIRRVWWPIEAIIIKNNKITKKKEIIDEKEENQKKNEKEKKIINFFLNATWPIRAIAYDKI